MFDLGRLVGANRITCAMLFFTIAFYAAVLLADRAATVSAPAAKANALKAAELDRQTMKSREAAFIENIKSKPGLITAVSLAASLVLLAGLVLSFYFAVRGLKGSPPIAAEFSHSQARWGLREVVQVFVFLFFIEALILSLESLLYFVAGFEPIEKDVFLISNSLFRDLFTAGLVVYLVKVKFGQPASELGLTTSHFFKNVATGLVGYVTIVPALVLTLAAISWGMQRFSYEPPPQAVVQIYLKDSTRPFLVQLTFFVAVLGPIIEEIFFRGFTYKAFRTRFGVGRAMVLTALIFAALHMSVAAMLPIFLLGLFLTYLYEKTGSLVPSMTVHVLHNLIMVALTLGFKSLAGQA